MPWHQSAFHHSRLTGSRQANCTVGRVEGYGKTGWLCSLRDGSVLRTAFWSAVNAASAGNVSYREENLGSTSKGIGIGVITENTRESESAQCSGLGCHVRVVRQAFPSEIGLREMRGLEYTASPKTRGEQSPAACHQTRTQRDR